MWIHITRLEDKLLSRFGRGAVPQLSPLRSEKSSAPPTAGTRGNEIYARHSPANSSPHFSAILHPLGD
ncbi:hypothetical protein RSOLAG1IB_07552 [Rhizoctonia solani AG-1 IB]|uniref:Uncharacterized protein n=1 Tax=Thanatephorus cucumeris (strain AG1-IB / isolate 7/3/14) TaxID=1108050 RepID=A0A0B7FGT5_THACB|nr:hypothetical protein RSOLAG1IB_07552 [Rhizoctonia solani AG-1 IB]